jgi:hypothetical protein
MKSGEYTSGSEPIMKPQTLGTGDYKPHTSHDLRLTNDGVYCRTCNKLIYGNAEEDISAFLDPAPIASLVTMIGQNIKDPIENAIRKKFSEVNGSDWTQMTQEQRRNAVLSSNVNLEEDNSLHLIAGKDWSYLTPATKQKLESIEAETYKDLKS